MPHRVIPIILVLTLGLGYLGYQWWTTRDTDPNRLAATGSLEGTTVVVASEMAGRVSQVLVERGATVEQGQPLVRLDDTELRRRFIQAPAGGPEQALLKIQLEKLTLRAPAGGVISARAIEPGEVVAPGAPLLTIERTEDIKAILYVSERLIGRMHIGQAVSLTTDSFPGVAFSGQIDYIAPRPEFTPRNVQAPRDRALLVFEVRARVPNADGRLKAGMPIDAVVADSAVQ
jgi:multidrug resistance efflux pump